MIIIVIVYKWCARWRAGSPDDKILPSLYHCVLPA